MQEKPHQSTTVSIGRTGSGPFRKAAFLATIVVATLVASACSDTSGPDAANRSGRSQSGASPQQSPRIKRVGGVDIAVPRATVPPNLRPYPYVTPTPPPEATQLDGTYMKIRTLDQLGGVPEALPIKCLRCAPFQPHPGVTTLVLHRGTYFVEHQMSGFRTLGHYVVDGRGVTFFNDVNCTQERGRYRWARHGEDLILSVVRDNCSGTARADDFTTLAWTRIDPCVFRILRLWPAPLECG